MMKSFAATASAVAVLASPAAIAQQSPPQAMIAPPRALAVPHHGKILVERDTLIRLMVLNEVSTKTTKPGERFVLRVDEPVVVNGVTVVPVGAKAWGEVLTAESSGAAGKAGKLSARLLHLDAGGAEVPIAGENQTKGEKGTTQVALGALAFGMLAPLALLAPGNNAKLKAGEIFTAYFASDMLFDPASSTFEPAPQQAAAPLVVEVK